jgi:hypothetical protein
LLKLWRTIWSASVALLIIVAGLVHGAGVVTQGGPKVFGAGAGAPVTCDFFAGPSGSDANAGTSQGAPWAITALYSKATSIAGKTTCLLDGTYVLTSATAPSANTGDSGWAQAVRSTAAGTAGAHTIIRALNTRQAILTTWNGSAYYQTTGVGAPTVLEVQCQYCDIVGLKIANGAGHGLTVAASNITIDGVWITDHNSGRHTGQADSNTGGIYFRGSTPAKTNIWIKNSRIDNIVHGGSTGGDANCIGDLFGVDGVLIEYNTLHDCATASYWKTNAFNVVYRYNHIYNSDLTLEGWAMGTGTNDIYCNIIAGNNMGGAPSANSNGAAATIARVYSNTIVLNLVNGSNAAASWGGYVVMQGSGTAGEIQWFNNALDLDVALTFGDLYRWPASTEAPANRITIWDYNANTRFKATDNVGSLSTTSYATWQGSGYDTHSPALGSLGLVDRTDPSVVANMAPGPGSILLNAGRTGGLVGGSVVNIGHTACGITPGVNWLN